MDHSRSRMYKYIQKDEPEFKIRNLVCAKVDKTICPFSMNVYQQGKSKLANAGFEK
jgi:hypothetical protein